MKILIEKLACLYEYDKSFFSYDVLESDMWHTLLTRAMDEFHIFFDLENNDSKHIQRIITIPQSQWEFTECKFKCELFYAGGDWEIPVLYFKCQLVSGYAINLGIYKNSHFIFIPNKTEGNYHLVASSKNNGKWLAPENNNYKDGIDPKANEKECCKSLEKYLDKLVKLEIEKCQRKL